MPFPNVPNVPGVPALLRSPAVSATISLLVADAFGFLLGLGGPIWGIYLNGAPVVLAESVVAFDYRQGWSLADYPTEQGGFESYDKVNSPFDAKVRFTSGGSEATRQALLDSIAAIGPTLDLYDVITPEAIYRSVNVARYDYRRTSTNGVGLIAVDVWLTEIRITATAAFSNTKAPAGASAQSGGTVNTLPPTTSQQALTSSVQ